MCCVSCVVLHALCSAAWVQEEAYSNADERIEREEAERLAAEKKRLADELRERRIEEFIISRSKRKPFKVLMLE